MTCRPIPILEDHLWYPILVKAGGGHLIIEMRGSDVNRWNRMVQSQYQKETVKGWTV